MRNTSEPGEIPEQPTHYIGIKSSPAMYENMIGAIKATDAVNLIEIKQS